jgi:putative redox protein
MAITMRMYAQRKGWKLGQVEIRLEAEKTDRGVLSAARVHIQLDAGLGEEEQARLKEIAGRCPTHKALSTGISIVQA